MKAAFPLEKVRASIRRLMDENGGGAKPLAGEMGLGETALRDIFLPKTKTVGSKKLHAIAAHYGVTMEAILAGTATTKGSQGGEEASVPVIGFVGAGGEVIFEDAFAKGDALYEVGALPGMKADGLLGLEVRGDSMYPVIRDGHVAFFRRDGWDRVEDDALRDWAVCRLKDGRTLLKEVRPSAEPGKYDLISTNAPPIEAVELTWATPVVGWRRR